MRSRSGSTDQGRLPIIVGVAQLVNRSEGPGDARESLDMMVQVAHAAAADAQAKGLLERADSVQVVNTISWSYRDAPGFLAEAIGAQPREKVYTAVGGNTPQWLVSRTADAIVRGDVRLAVIAGGEAMRSRARWRGSGQLHWRRWEQPQEMLGDTRPGVNDVEVKHGAHIPTRIYPLFETAIRAHRGRSIAEHQRHLGQLFARLSQVAADNPYAWFPQARTAEEIITVTPENRMICFPYLKFMNAIMEVDQAAAVIMTSVATAQELGIPRDRWVYLWGCADAVDIWYFSERRNFHASPALALAGRRVLEMAGLAIDDIDWFDLYSCFPCAVELACAMLGIAEDDPRPLTVTGGLPYFGGPGNNYGMHAIASMVERLRREPQRKGLVSTMGWYVTKHSLGIYSGAPPEREWERRDSPEDQAELDASPHPTLSETPQGRGTVEAYTVGFDRSGEPQAAIVVGRLEEGSRFIANTPPDRDLLLWMTQEEMVGRQATVRHDPDRGKNVVTIE
jgi:acetyl-CoA C-acetyltransferase